MHLCARLPSRPQRMTALTSPVLAHPGATSPAGSGVLIIVIGRFQHSPPARSSRLRWKNPGPLPKVWR